MARYLTRLLRAKQLWNESSAAIYRGGPVMAGNLTRLLGASGLFPRYGLTARIAEGHLGRAMMSTVGGSVSVPTSSSSSLCLRSLDDYVGKPAEGSQNIPYEGSSDPIYFSVDDLDSHMQNLRLDEEDLLMDVLPVMRRTFHYGQWSLLQRYCCSKVIIIDIKEALENELAAMCVWFLFIDVPTHVKEGVAWALKDICSRTSEAATNMHIDEESVTRHAPTKMSSFDQESVNALLIDVLCSKNEEVLRQVCCSLGFVAKCRSYQAVSFGNGIQKKLIQLSRDFKCDSPVLAHIFFAISRIGMFNKGMREKIIEAEFSDGFLRRILSREGHRNSSFEAEAYYMVYTIARGQCSDELWKYLKDHLMPHVVDRCFACNINVMRARACVISSFIAKASPRCIKELVDLGCLRTLIRLLTNDDLTIKDYCFEAVETILSLGDADPSKNEYAKMIDDLTKEWGHIHEWGVFFVNNPQAYKNLVVKGSCIMKKYRPDKYLEWLKWQEYLGARSILNKGVWDNGYDCPCITRAGLKSEWCNKRIDLKLDDML